MKNIRGFAAGLVVGTALALAGAGFAQSTTQTETAKTKESCCAMQSSCCQRDSCSMNHEGMDQSKQHANDGTHKGGCCCCGDSCDMKMKEKHEKQDKQKKG